MRSELQCLTVCQLHRQICRLFQEFMMQRPRGTRQLGQRQVLVRIPPGLAEETFPNRSHDLTVIFGMACQVDPTVERLTLSALPTAGFELSVS